MANPTVEDEMRLLLPADLNYVVGRLVSPILDPVERLRSYAKNVVESVGQFGGMTLDAVGFACTGSSYLLEPDTLKTLAGRIGVPFIWATDAIAETLRHLDAHRLAIVSPYPTALHSAACAHWSSLGFEIVSDTRVEIGGEDTRAIYKLSSIDAETAIYTACASDADVILLSGTGMPTFSRLALHSTPPIISSNYCLARALMRASGTGR